MDGRVKACIVLAVVSFSVPIVWIIIGGEQAWGGDVIASTFTMILIVLGLAVGVPSLIIAAVLARMNRRDEDQSEQ